MAKTNSVFKKAVMAVSGIIMVLYLIAHVVGNLKAFSGADAFNSYSGWIRTVGNPAVPGQTALWTIRIVLLVAVVAHFWAAVSLWRQAKRARPESYVTKKSVAQSYASRTMRWGGVIVLAFIIYHILDLTTGTVNAEGFDSTPYDRLVASFSNPFVTAFYAIAVILLGMHLRHGIWSATQTLGQSNRRREKTVSLFALGFSTVLTLGFLLVPFSVLFNIID
ncbi:succinate dehydrogenase cytochrome b subunit [Blastococcus brunescens]|uniref:Succinate dehydrogenase cytochrome b subunit n=1 Tax=Blastococcus brunescens TaxID=1564165 RepID=A0ABZ1B250_9ACTN|nr:succinate dehydrogenase cytochrome b subunit [Blastococcus sp. BMG 8361]WRL64890.1 succinate dehydrogenase cytochrome b subunit [Blastococcus sp. BMG 8361]